MNRDTPAMRLIRFSIVGVVVALIYLALFLAFRQLTLPRIFASTIALLIAVAVQYVLQTVWTFQKEAANQRHIVRFVAMVLAGMGIAAVITEIVGPRLGLTDAQAGMVVVVTLPIFNFVLLSLWVYAKPERGE